MAGQNDLPACTRCWQRFTKTSSLKRHVSRCHQDRRAPSRQKACRNCSISKLRCNLQRPACSRCQSRSTECHYPSGDGEQLPMPPLLQGQDPRAPPALGSLSTSHHRESAPLAHGTATHTMSYAADTWYASSQDTSAPLPIVCGPSTAAPGDVDPDLTLPPDRKRVLLGQPGTPNTQIVVRHTVQYVVRILRVWPRMLASYSATDHLPPIIHQLQFTDGMPAPLANCCTLPRMWADNSEEGSRLLVKGTIIEEIRRLLREQHYYCFYSMQATAMLIIIRSGRSTQYPSYTKDDLIAAAQSVLLLLIILFFGLESSPVLSLPLDPELLVTVWDVKQRLGMTGLFLEEEIEHRQPLSWRDWVMVSVKRRTIMGLSHVEWAWSIIHGYPVLSCFELTPLPAPAARTLWHAADQPSWERLYREWLWKWRKGGCYKMVEFFKINPIGALDLRSEMWLAEADEFGMILMAEVNAIGDDYLP